MELRKGEHYHKDAIRLNTARNCFEYVLRSRQYTQVYVPYYTCEVLLEPIKKLGVNYKFYSINEQFEPISLPSLDADTAFLYTNYYGMKQKCVERLSEKYGSQLIVDNAQAFYSEPMQRIDTFYSARKFFGVSDGAYLYTGKRLEQNLYQDVSYKRMSHLLKRIDLGAELGYLDFRNDDDMLCNQDIKQMSKLTDNVLSGIDYEAAKRKRRENYTLLDEFLRASNQISLELDERAVPMVYPYLTDDLSLRRRLIENKVFVATYWSNVKGWTTEDMLERKLMERLIPIPCDQRYGEKEMSSIVSLVLGTR